MKKYLIVIAVLLLTACSHEPKATNTNVVNINKEDNSPEMKSLKEALAKYTEATISHDAKTLVSFVYPKVFTIVPKEKMLKMLTKTFSSKDAPIIKDVKHTKIEPIKKYDKGIYSIITSSITTVIKSPRPNDGKFEIYMLQSLKRNLNTKATITLDKKKHIFSIRHSTKTIALNEKGSWKFIGFKQAKKYISKGIFPSTLIDKIK